MEVTIDIETQGLDATKFIMGCIVKEDYTNEVFYNKKRMWERILEIGEECQKKRNVLYVRGHNIAYDFYGIVNIKDTNLTYYNTGNPFIVSYTKNKKEYIKFLDTMSFFRMSLKNASNLVNYPKMETPKELLETQTKGKLTKKQLKEIETYMIRDAEICMKLIYYLKEKCEKEGIYTRRLITIHQVAINNFNNYLANLEEKENEHILKDVQRRRYHWTFYKNEIHEAYRGGIVEAYQTGKFKDVKVIDINNLYGWSAMNMPFPDLRTSIKLNEPLTYMGKEIFNKIGVSKCIIKCPENYIGLLLIRTQNKDKEDYNYIPKNNEIIIGTWTNIEIKEAIKLGYKVLYCEWTVIYEEGKNVFKKYVQKMYDKRIKENNEFNKFFYKSMINSLFGKMGQRNIYNNSIMIKREKIDKYVIEGYEIIDEFDEYYMIRKKIIKETYKPYYAPIISTYINAYSRIKLIKESQKIPKEDLLYSDTDSIVFKNNHINKFNINPKEIGSWKIEPYEGDGLIYCKKFYSVGSIIKASGVPKRNLRKEEFDNGKIKYKRMIGISKARTEEDIGTFEEIEEDLKKMENNHKTNETILKNRKVFKDTNTVLSINIINALTKLNIDTDM